MRILGVHGGDQFADEDGQAGYAYHDSAAVLMHGAEIVAAIEEERLCRVKHANTFPVNAVRFCLDRGGLRLDDVEAIAVNLSRPFLSLMERIAFLQDPSVPGPPDGPHRLTRLFERAFHVDVGEKLRFCPHHIAHAWSAFVPSGFERSLVLSIDGSGEFASGMVLVGEGRRIVKLKEFSLAQSLGNLYAQLISVLGYSRFDEYKVMGLAPYGDPSRYESLFNGFYQCLPEGDYRLKSPAECFADVHAAGLFAHARRRGEPFSQVHKDFAAALQSMLERIVLHVLRHYQRVTGAVHVCLAGGVAHNCTVNGKVLTSGVFDSVFVQPAAHDAGGALGAAWWAYYETHPTEARPRLAHLYHGSDIGTDDRVRAALCPWSGYIDVEECDRIAARTAALLADGAVVGWMQGRSEFGPRALGNRSILADPRPADHKRLINQMVKKRESYRPFAPSVLEERATDYFELPPAQTRMPFMIFVVGVKPERHAELGAVTHVDGTARVHTVSRETNAPFWELISEFDKLTGMPVLLNTSFNNNAEPIVDSVDEGVACFLTTGIDYLVVGRFLVRRKDAPPAWRPDWLSLAPALPSFKKLVKREGFDPHGAVKWSHSIESSVSRYFGRVSAEVSEDLFALLLHADGRTPLWRLIDEAQLVLTPESEARLTDEVLNLWSQRALALRPPTQQQGNVS